MYDKMLRWKLRVECELKGSAHEFAVTSIKVDGKDRKNGTTRDGHTAAGAGSFPCFHERVYG